MSATTRRRRRQQREESRRAILDAADRTLRAAPFRELSVDQLMAETGLSRTVFYRHFSDLGDLVLQLMQSFGSEIAVIADRWTDPDGSEPVGRESIADLVEFFRVHGRFVRAIVDAAAYDDEIAEVYHLMTSRFVEQTRRSLDAHVAAGHLPPLDTEETARALGALNEHYLLASFGGATASDPARVQATLWDIWRRVLYARADGEP